MAFYVAHEARIGEHEVFPHMTAYGPYKTREYARRVMRRLATEYHGAKVQRGADSYVHIHHVTGLRNIHRVNVVEGTTVKTSNGREWDLTPHIEKW